MKGMTWSLLAKVTILVVAIIVVLGIANLSANEWNGFKNFLGGKIGGTQIECPEGVDFTFDWPLPQHTVIASCLGDRDQKYCSVKPCSSFHKGVDIGAPSGTNILAIADGTVSVIDKSPYNKLEITHGDSYNNYKSLYLHNKEILVKKGEKVSKGQVIATIGGYYKGDVDYYYPHLHLSIKDGKDYIDPLCLFDRAGIGLVYKENANCVYYAEAYPYSYEIENSVVTV